MRILNELIFIMPYLIRLLINKIKPMFKYIIRLYSELFMLVIFLSSVFHMAGLLNGYVVVFLISSSILLRLFYNKFK